MNHPRFSSLRRWIAASSAFVFSAVGYAEPATDASAPITAKRPLVVVVDTPPPPAPEGVPLQIGMSAKIIRDMLGRPAAIRPMEVESTRAEVWVYARNAGSRVRPVSTRSESVPWVDPITGEMRMLQEPVIEYLTETRAVELRLLMFRGKLINWAEVPAGTRRSFHQ